MKWVIRGLAVVLAAFLIVPAVRKLTIADAPMPLPAHTWTRDAASIEPRSQQFTIPKNLQPSTVYIPELGVVMPFRDAGEQAGWLQIGHSITEGVHFANGSSLNQGSYLVAAHINSRNLDMSPFAKLVDVQPGTLILVTDAHKRVREYLASSLNKYLKSQLPDDIFRTSGTPELVLVTCGGKLVTLADGHRYYEDNVVVVGVPYKA